MVKIRLNVVHVVVEWPLASKGENLNWLPMNPPFLQKKSRTEPWQLTNFLLQFSQACKTKYFSCFIHQRSERLGENLYWLPINPPSLKKTRTEPWLLTNDIGAVQLSQACKKLIFVWFIKDKIDVVLYRNLKVNQSSWLCIVTHLTLKYCSQAVFQKFLINKLWSGTVCYFSVILCMCIFIRVISVLQEVTLFRKIFQ